MGKKRYQILFSDEQDEKLRERSAAVGFDRRSDYIRFTLFMELSFIEKIDQIHKKIMW